MVPVIEKNAANLEMPIILEGTSPSFDPRLEVVKITPDPSVIEVKPPARHRKHPRPAYDARQGVKITIQGSPGLERDGRESPGNPASRSSGGGLTSASREKKSIFAVANPRPAT
jgi:uncharacterized protein (DUF2126 family)